MATQYGDSPSILSVSMEGPFGGSGSSVKVTNITIYADQWKGATSPYSQVITVEGVSVNSKVDFQPSAEQLESFGDLPVSLLVENNEGEVTVYAVGEKPKEDYTLQATITEVIA